MMHAEFKEMPIVARYPASRVRAIAMPVGGIGTGCVALAGDGALIDWQLMSRPHRGWRPPWAHMLLRVHPQGDKARLRVLEGITRLQLDADHGAPQTLAGLPRMRPLGFEAAYPFGRALLRDPELPLQCAIEAFNPLIPEATDDSSLPFALLTVALRNRGSAPLEASVVFVLTNFIGDDGIVRDQKGNITEFARAHGWRGLLFRKQTEQRSPRWGTLALLTDAESAVAARRWAFRRWDLPTTLMPLTDWLLENPTVPDAAPRQPCPPSDERGWESSISVPLTLAPNQTVRVRFLLCWHFPYRHMREVGWWHGESDPIVRNHYALRFEDARRVAEYVIPRLSDLWERTARFVEGIVARHPAPIAESALNCLAVLRSPTVFRLEDGTFCGFEGCNADTGCCFGSCTHVWNYEQATLSLFPDLHRSMLEAHLRYGTMDDGAHRFRLDLPLGANAYALAAADGQMGLIVRSYMQYRRTGDRAWLERWYPTLKKLLAFAWQPGSWDADQDGVMEGAQHNTYDVEFFGPNPVCGTWYLAALRAMEEAARLLGDIEFAQKCRTLFESGSRWMDANLFNGAFYVQQIRPVPENPAPDDHPAQRRLPPLSRQPAGRGVLHRPADWAIQGEPRGAGRFAAALAYPHGVARGAALQLPAHAEPALQLRAHLRHRRRTRRNHGNLPARRQAEPALPVPVRVLDGAGVRLRAPAAGLRF
jgi:non-lysosomal glucosylceramidase